jgi:hypothetical protein
MSTLTDAQRLDVRRWMGYPSLGADEIDYVRWTSRYSSMTLTQRLEALTSAEETMLVDKYLTHLETLEGALLSASANLDTDTAGPWKANPREITQRTSLYNKWRRDMCGFLGFEPGPALGSGGISIVRC